MGTKRARWIRSVAALALCLLVACEEPELGSQEDLSAQVDAIDLPTRMVQLDHTYIEPASGPAPNFVTWYQVNGPLEETRAELIDSISRAGWDVKETSAGLGVFTARKKRHILFLVVNEEMISKNTYAPVGAKVEMSVMPLPDVSSG